MKKDIITDLTPSEVAVAFKEPDTLKDYLQNPVTFHLKGIKGPLLNPDRPKVAIVGSRDIGPDDMEITRQIVRALSENKGCPVILSGLAFGVDITAHMEAVNCGLHTYAFMATGLDQVYPYRHVKQAETIVKNGGLVTSFPEKTAPIAINFLRRTHEMIAASNLVIIVCSKAKGTSMVAARYADELNIPVLAVPGKISDPRHFGCNQLIAEGYAECLYDLNKLKDMQL